MSHLFYLFSSLLLSAAFIFILITSTFQARVLFFQSKQSPLHIYTRTYGVFGTRTHASAHKEAR